MNGKVKLALVGVVTCAVAVGTGLGVASAGSSGSDSTVTAQQPLTAQQQAAQVAVSSTETFLGGQTTLAPPGDALRLANLVTPSEAIQQDRATSAMAKDSPTVEFGLYSDNTQGTLDPATGSITNLTHQQQPAYFIIHHGATISPGEGRVWDNETAVTVVDAQTGKSIDFFAQPAGS